MNVHLTTLPYSFDMLRVKLSIVKLLYPNLVLHFVSVGLFFLLKFPLCNSVSGALGEWMAFLFFFLGAPSNVTECKENIEKVICTRKKGPFWNCRCLWWASHRFQTPRLPKDSVWSSACRLSTSSFESPTRSHPSVTLLTIYWPAYVPVLLSNAVKVLKVAQDEHKELHNTLCTHYNCHWKPVWGIFLDCRLPRTQRCTQHTRARIHAHTHTPPLLRRSNRPFWRQFNLPPEWRILAQMNASVTQVILATHPALPPKRWLKIEHQPALKRKKSCRKAVLQSRIQDLSFRGGHKEMQFCPN